MNKPIWIIKDWAGNILDHTGYFKSPSFAAPMEFTSFEDGWDWLYQAHPNEEDFSDYYVVSKTEVLS